MKRLPLLLLSLGLAGPALALGPVMPAAPDPMAAAPEAIDVRGLSLMLLFSNTAEDFKACLDNPDFVSDLQGSIHEDLKIHGLGGNTWLGDSTAFSSEEKAAAALLPGFVPAAREGSDKDMASMQGQVVEVLHKAMGDTKDPARLDALRQEAAGLRARFSAGKLKAMPEDLRTACVGVTVLASVKDRGPMVDMYRAYLKQVTAEYTAYRSQEGYLAARWGMTPAEVAKAEGLPLATLRSGKLVRIDGSPAKVTYQFTDGRLSDVVVTFTHGCKPAACLNRYRTVNGLLVEKYGAGEDNSTTDEQALRENASMLFEGMGRERYPWMLIEAGYRREEHRWQTSESLLVHQLYSRKKARQAGATDLVHTMRYTSRKFQPRADYLRRQQEEAEKKKRLQNL